jgi:hypothetical protein
MQALLGLIVLIGAIGLGVFGLQAGGGVQQAVVVILTAIVGFVVWRAQTTREYARNLEDKLATDKRAVYKLYVDVIRKVAEGTKSGRAFNSEELIGNLRLAAFMSLLNASDEVVRAEGRFMQLANQPDKSNLSLAAMADVLLAMRRDSGQEETTLEPSDLMAVWIKDMKNMDSIFSEWEAVKASASVTTASRRAGRS